MKENIHKMILDRDVEISKLKDRLLAANIENERLLDAVKFAYRKHHLGDDFFGWEELSEILLTALCESMGDEGYQKWLASLKQTEGGRE